MAALRLRIGFWIPAGSILVVLALAPIVWRSAEQTASKGPPNVILVSIDTLRPDHLSGNGYRRATSPFLDSMARDGVRFVEAFAQASWTLPSHMSLITSCYPQTHQVENENRSLPESIPTLAEALQGAGYETTAFISWALLSAKFGFDRGFDQFHELVPARRLINPTTESSIKAEQFADRVAEWAQGPPDTPFFLFLHLFDPHMSYEPPLEYANLFDASLRSVTPGTYNHLRKYIRGLDSHPRRIPRAELRKATALYDGEIRYTDHELQRLFRLFSDQGLLENTLIVITSDHGEELNEHGSMEGHQWTLYDEVLRVPLTIVFPDGRHRGTTVDRIVQTIDIAPTILEIVGMEPPIEFEGHSLIPLLTRSDDREQLVFSHIRRFNQRWALRTEDYKLIFTQSTGTNRFGVPLASSFELYDLKNDPAEQQNIYHPDSPTARALAARLRAMMDRRQDLETKTPQLSDEEWERLRSLGYVK